jgi:biotin carboxylase
MSLKSNHPQAIWLFAGGAMQRAAVDAIERRGFKLILSDGNADCLQAGRADCFLHLDTFGIAENKQAALEVSKNYDIRAVFTAAADCHETVAEVARLLGLPGIDPAIARACRYKYETRKILTAAGIPQPRYAIVETLDEAKAALARIGLPAALKATDNSGSRGFTRLETESGLDEKSFNHALANGTTGRAIIEELLIPLEDEIAEQSVETVWYDGEMRWLNWVDRLFRKDFDLVGHPWGESANPYESVSWAVELGHINPARHAASRQAEVETMIRRAGLALGMGTQKGGHILKADLMLTTRGPMILELTPRLSGGWDSGLSTIKRGGDFTDGALGLALGEKLDDAYWKRYFAYRRPETTVAVIAEVKTDAQDCIGREFAWGAAADRADAIAKAYTALRAGEIVR